MAVHTCILALEKWEQKDHKFSHPLLPRELQASLRPCVKKQKQKQEIETEQHSGSRSRGISVSSEAAWSTTVTSKPAKAT